MIIEYAGHEISIVEETYSTKHKNVETHRTRYGYSCSCNGSLIAACSPHYASYDSAVGHAKIAVDSFLRKLSGRARYCTVVYDAEYAETGAAPPWQAISPAGRVVGRGSSPAQAFNEAKAKGWKLEGSLPLDPRSSADSETEATKTGSK